MESSDPPGSHSKENAQEILGLKMELLQTRRYLQCILQHSNDIIFATDAGGILVSFGRGGEKALGYPREEVAGRPIRDLAVDPSEFDRLTALAQEMGNAAHVEFPFRHKAGHTIYCDVSLIAFTRAEGQTVGTVGIGRDVTQQKKLQEDLIRVDRLAEIGRTASGIAHEINNPLAIIGEISGWIRTVAGDAKGLTPEDREEIERAVRFIQEQTRRCRSITHQLLSFVRDSGPSRASVDIHKLLEETVSFLNPDLKYKEILVSINLMEGPLVMDSDKQMLEQVLVNLLSNAVYAVEEKGGKGGRIDIATARVESMIEIRISDNGAGISEENQKRMFDLFFTTKPPGKGTGLGLPICQNIIRKLGGDLSFKTEAGEGTTFFVRLPVS
ncbi:MAG: Histidine kinase [Thermodesulfobacteriota bacterium]|nr:Histidine kinase [Thermodesulfobacteriota bacterium]